MLDRPRQAKHYLITVEMFFADVHVHGYIMCHDQDFLDVALNRIVDEAEKALGKHPTMILQTELTTGVETVREIVRKYNPDTWKLDNAVDHYLGAWLMPTANPDDKILMDLH